MSDTRDGWQEGKQETLPLPQETSTEVSVEHDRQSLMSLQLLRHQIECWRPCSCRTHRLSAAHSPENDPQLATKETKPTSFSSFHPTGGSCPPPPLSSLPLRKSFTFLDISSLFHSEGGYVPHKPTVSPLLIDGLMGFVPAWTPPCWFPSKQWATELLLEEDVPPGRGSSPGATGEGGGTRQAKSSREEKVG